jgi:hypothetical protein
MKRCRAVAAVVVLVTLCGGALVAPARAAPPTVTPSPGYDARLQEERAASRAYQSPAPAPRHRVRPSHHRRHPSG